MSKPRRISELSFTTNLSISDLVPVVNNGETKSTTVGSIGSTVTSANLPVSSSGIEVSGSVSISETLSLSPQDPLPSGSIGDLAVSGSSLYFFNGSWTQVV